MHKVYFIYLLDNIEESYLNEFTLEVLDQIDKMEGNHIIRLYAVTSVKEYLKQFKEQRLMDIFLVKSKKYETVEEVEDVLAELSKYELSLNPYAYACENGIKSTVDIVSPGFEYEHCRYNIQDTLSGNILSLSSLFDKTMECVNDEFRKALDKYHFYDILYRCTSPDSVPPWETMFEINELGVFIESFGFSITKKDEGGK